MGSWGNENSPDRWEIIGRAETELFFNLLTG